MIRTPEMNDICEFGILALADTKDTNEKFNAKFEKYNKLKTDTTEGMLIPQRVQFLYIFLLLKHILRFVVLGLMAVKCTIKMVMLVTTMHLIFKLFHKKSIGYYTKVF